MFKKLQAFFNHKQWAEDVSFALEEARFEKQLEETSFAYFFLWAKKNDIENRGEKIFAQEEKICKFQADTNKAVAKIEKNLY